MSAAFATLRLQRQLPVPLASLWQAWTAPEARALWALPAGAECLETAQGLDGREVSLARVAGRPDLRCERRWLAWRPGRFTVNAEVMSRGDVMLSSAQVTAIFAAEEADIEGSRLAVAVQLASLAEDAEDGEAACRERFNARLDDLAAVAARTMVLERVIAAPRARVWGAWSNPETLPQWWGPQGFSCRTRRIALRPGGEWVFDMIGPDGSVFPNHHRYGQIHDGQRLGYTLLWGEDGPKHADAWAAFEDVPGGATRVVLGMIFASEAEFREAKGFGAVELGLQTLGKLAGFVGAA